MLTITWGKTLYKAKIKATFKINLNVAFNMAQTVGFEPTWHCCQIDFESSTSKDSSYISLFCLALNRLFFVLTLVFDILTYFVLYVARGCLGNI